MTNLLKVVVVAAVVGGTVPANAAALIVVTGPGYAPFADPDLRNGGLAVTVLEAALASQDRSITVKFRPWRRGYQRTVNGDVDGTFPYVRTKERAQDVLFSEPMFQVKPKVVSSAQAPVEFDGTKASLDGHRMCLPEGYAPQKMLKEMIAAGRLTTLKPSSLDKCLPLVQRDRADFVVVNNFVWPSTIEEASYRARDFHVSDQEVEINNLYFIVGKAHEKPRSVLATVNDGLAAIRKNGKFEEIVQGYLGESS